MTGLVDRILGLPGWLVLIVAGLIVFAEDALFVGFVLPGETVAFLAGAAARIGHASLPGVVIVVIVGDTVGYEIGRHGGTRVLRWHVLEKRRRQLDRAEDFLTRRGGSAVFLGRWIAFFRAVLGDALVGSPTRASPVPSPAGAGAGVQAPASRPGGVRSSPAGAPTIPGWRPRSRKPLLRRPERAAGCCRCCWRWRCSCWSWTHR